MLIDFIFDSVKSNNVDMAMANLSFIQDYKSISLAKF